MKTIVTWQKRDTLDIIHNSCYIYFFRGGYKRTKCLSISLFLILFPRNCAICSLLLPRGRNRPEAAIGLTPPLSDSPPSNPNYFHYISESWKTVSLFHAVYLHLWMVLQGLVVGDWASVYKVVAITPAGAPHQKPCTIHQQCDGHHHIEDARDRGAGDQCSIKEWCSAPAFRSATLSPPPGLPLLLCDATCDPPSAPSTSHL